MAALVRTCARTRLGTHDAIADAVREFGTDHLLERRRRIDRSSSGTVRAAEAVTAFDVATTPKGRQTLPIGDDWATEAPTLRRRATSAQEIDVDVELSKEPPEVVSASGDFTPLVEALEPAAEPEDDVSHGLAALELASDELASDEPLAERIPSMIELAREPQKPRPVRRGSRRVWAVAIAVLTVCVAVVVVAFSLHAPRETATAPLDSVPMRAPALGGTVAPPASIAPEATATPAPTTSTAPSASALPKGAPSKRPPKPLRAPGQYDPASI
jgi:hypothetical protein